MINTKKKKMIIGIVLFLISFLIFMFYDFNNYDEEYVIGKTKAEIIKKYGEFDITYNMNAEGLCTIGAYKIKYALFWHMLAMIVQYLWGWEQSYYDTEFLWISFDENDIAYYAYISVPYGK